MHANSWSTLVISVIQSPVKNAVIIPANVPINSMGSPKVDTTSSGLRILSVRRSPIVRVNTRTMPTAEKNENKTNSILVCVELLFDTLFETVTCVSVTADGHINAKQRIRFVVATEQCFA